MLYCLCCIIQICLYNCTVIILIILKLTDLIQLNLSEKICERHTLTMFSSKIKKVKMTRKISSQRSTSLYQSFQNSFVHLKLIHFDFLKETTFGVHILLRKYQFQNLMRLYCARVDQCSFACAAV